MDFLQLWSLVRRGWRLLALSIVLGVAVAAGVSWLQPTLYSATSTGYVVAGSSATVGDAFAGKSLAADKAATYLPLVGSRSVAERIAEDMGLESVPGTLNASNDGVIFHITATASSPELAAGLADAAIRATSEEANALETMTVSGENSDQTVVRIVPVELAQTPTQPVSPDWERNLLIGLGLGALAGLGLVVGRHSLDRRVRETSKAEEITQSSVLGVVPKTAELGRSALIADRAGAAAEALRQLRTNLRFVSVDSPVRSIVVTSSNENEGKSTIAANLAAMLADSGEPTVLVDADLRLPVQATNFGEDPQVGLSQVLAGSVELEHALIRTQQEGLLLLPAGRIPPNPSELVGSRRMKELIATLSASHMVIVDAPPLLPVTDAVLLTVASDGAIVVVQSGKTRTEQLALAARKIGQVEGTLLGVVLNMVPKKDLGPANYGYGYGYGNTSSRYYRSADETMARDQPSKTPKRAKRAIRLATPATQSDQGVHATLTSGNDSTAARLY